MRNLLDKSYSANQNTHFMYNNVFLPGKSCRFSDDMGSYCRSVKVTYVKVTRRMRFSPPDN
jgi:hypothetical protein